MKNLSSKAWVMNVIVITACLALMSACSTGRGGGENSKPNVIIINADDVGYGDVGAYGATKVKTPNIDRLAEEGRMFTDFHSASAVCSPSRYALLTGEYPSRRESLWGPLMLRDTLVIETSQMTSARLMKEAGYTTAVIGKWHLGFQNEYPVDWNKKLKPGPLELGFDYFFGIPVLNSHPPFVYVENHRIVGWTSKDPLVYGQEANTRYFDEKFGIDAIGGAEAAHELYKDRETGKTLANKATEWIREHQDEPFFLYFATPQIHHPFTPAPQFIGSSDAGRYGDVVKETLNSIFTRTILKGIRSGWKSWTRIGYITCSTTLPSASIWPANIPKW